MTTIENNLPLALTRSKCYFRLYWHVNAHASRGKTQSSSSHTQRHLIWVTEPLGLAPSAVMSALDHIHHIKHSVSHSTRQTVSQLVLLAFDHAPQDLFYSRQFITLRVRLPLPRGVRGCSEGRSRALDVDSCLRLNSWFESKCFFTAKFLGDRVEYLRWLNAIPRRMVLELAI